MLQITTILIFASASIAAWVLLDKLFDSVIRKRLEVDRRLHDEFLARIHGQAVDSDLFRNLQSGAEENQSRLGQIIARLNTAITQSGRLGDAWQLLGHSAMLGLVAATSAYLLLGRVLPGLLFAGVASVVPFLQLVLRRHHRLGLLRRQLPEAFDMMSRSLRSGQAVPAAFQQVSEEFPSPVADEFALCFEQQHLGVAFERALRDMARRTGFVETQIFAAALIINRQAGGDLAAVLSVLSATIRNRDYFQRRIKALTGEGRMQAIVLTALPFLALLAVWLLNPEYAQVLIDRPSLLAAMVGMQIAGALCIQQILQLDF